MLLDAGGYVCLADMGFAKKVHDRTFTACGTDEYVPPELLEGAVNATCGCCCAVRAYTRAPVSKYTGVPTMGPGIAVALRPSRSEGEV